MENILEKVQEVGEDIKDLKDLMNTYGVVYGDTGGQTGKNIEEIGDEEIEKLKKEEEILIGEEQKLKDEEVELQKELLNVKKKSQKYFPF